MAAPDYVPKPTDEKPRVYESPPRRPDSWCADRPAEIDGLQPSGRQLGTPGPDQGYALKLARQFEGWLVLTPGESQDDAVAGCMAIALRHLEGQREAVVEFPPGEQPRFGAPMFKVSQVDVALVARAIASAIAAGWDPHSRGRTVEIAVDETGG